ncbi:hypothetical protein C9E88_17610 (plasmid) [Acinetobacter cumulans]|uniref:hypothetical protein n=1 Tax=Acinetobacter cumulans TaxID=2136182 RepID=UPI0012A8ECCD|nr:hypothetical protein [Acinetobacter cumulans]QFU78881.1 hypothetical protein C9E88_17610 [Acinetobacter cumulans]
MQPTEATVQAVAATPVVTAVNMQEPEQVVQATSTVKAQEGNTDHPAAQHLSEPHAETPQVKVVTADIQTRVEPIVEHVVEVAQNTTSTVQPK